MKVLVLGATGLLGNAVFRVLSQSAELDVLGTVRHESARGHFANSLISRLVTVDNLEDESTLISMLDSTSPDVIINCTSASGSQRTEPDRLISILSLLPQRLGHLTRKRNTRLVQIGSDGVFSGRKGLYSENDFPDASDPYGVAKILGEVDGPNAITLRTSVVGPALDSDHGLLSWFLRQERECRCYTRAIFSGLPAVVIASVIRDIVLPRKELHGIFHIAAGPISKFDLLDMVRQQYKKDIVLIPDDTVVIDRSLDATRFRLATGYTPPSWPEMIAEMHAFKFGLRDT